MDMKEKFERVISYAAAIIEICLSVLVLVAIAIASVSLVKELGAFEGRLMDVAAFETFLGHALLLVIGLEFIKMLVKRTPGAVIEVLLYAVARQLIVYHTTTLELFIGILAVAGIFAIRKYLFVPYFDEDGAGERLSFKRRPKKDD